MAKGALSPRVAKHGPVPGFTPGYLPLSEGWMSTPELDGLRAEAWRQTRNGRFHALELGVWKGLATSALTLASPLVICVDTFTGTPGEPCEGTDTFLDFTRNMRSLDRHNFVVLRTTTDDALLELLGTPGIGTILVDADHATAQVARDLRGAWRLLETDGTMFVDDAEKPGPKAALRAFAPDDLEQVSYVTPKLAALRKR